jgi:hypothetical protein
MDIDVPIRRDLRPEAAGLRRWLMLACAAVFLQLSAPAGAQPNASTERAGLLLGAFVTDRRSSTRLDGAGGNLGTDIDLEEDLGLDSSTSVGRLGGYLWFGRRHRFDAALFDLSRSASLPIDKTIEFGDEVFAINTVVTTKSDLQILKADYTFAALARDRGWLGVVGGLYIAKTSLALSEPTLGKLESDDLTAPLPLLGLRGEYAIGNRFTLRGAAQWFGYDAGDVGGRLTDLYVGADYAFNPRFALGLAYDRVSMNVDAKEDSGLSGRLDWGYDGILLYLKVDFGSRNAGGR